MIKPPHTMFSVRGVLGDKYDPVYGFGKDGARDPARRMSWAELVREARVDAARLVRAREAAFRDELARLRARDPKTLKHHAHTMGVLETPPARRDRPPAPWRNWDDVSTWTDADIRRAVAHVTRLQREERATDAYEYEPRRMALRRAIRSYEDLRAAARSPWKRFKNGFSWTGRGWLDRPARFTMADFQARERLVAAQRTKRRRR